MADALVIVESPAKAKTINKFLGSGYHVEPSMGHVRDLPKSTLGVDVEKGFVPSYELLEDRKKVVEKLIKEAKKATRIIVATDPDREGEAIGWHLREVLLKAGPAKPVLRVMFNEITKHAVLAAMEQATDIDQKRVDAQEARRIVDRLVGYQISPILWDKVRRGLSAGRVQSVALRMVCEREDEIDAFVAVEYRIVSAELAKKQPGAMPFRAKLVRRGKDELVVRSQSEWDELRPKLERAEWRVSGVETKERKRNPTAPFTTSKYQQEASKRFRMPVSIAMRVAQGLYEGKDIGDRGRVGLITYMRTDSIRVADSAIEEVRQHVEKTHGRDHLPAKPNVYKSKKGAQDAHEAIRPTFMDLPPQVVASFLSRDELNIYTLIWNRFVASQMLPALYDETIVEVEAAGHFFEARGSVLKFPGFMAVYTDVPEDDEDEQEGRFPVVTAGEALALMGVNGEQKFTQPPPRYSEATLVKALEENGIGRPSTYATILYVLQKEYTLLKDRRFHPTDVGRLVNGLLVKSFADIMDVGYTARLENELDEIEEGRVERGAALLAFNKKFVIDLARAKEEMPNIKAARIPTDQTCDKCGRPMDKRFGSFGWFLACSGYPECKNTREAESDEAQQFEEDCPNCSKRMKLRKGRFGAFLACPDYPTCRGTARIRTKQDGTQEVIKDRRLDEKCPECGHPMVEREGRFGKFTACSNYPTCKYIKQEKVGIACPREGCGGDLVVKRTRRSKAFYGCSKYPQCDFIAWDLPIPEPCPACGAPFVTQKETKRFGTYRKCFREECGWTDAPAGAVKAARPRTERPAPPARRPAARKTSGKASGAVRGRAGRT